MITCWDKNGKIIHQDQNDEDYIMWSNDTSVFGIRKSDKFPEDGYILTTDGEYRLKTLQEQVNDKTIDIDSYKESAYIRIASEANRYLLTAKTKSGYLVNNDAQKIAILTISMKSISDSDPDKKAYLSGGIIYDLDKAKEILNFCMDIKTKVMAANAAIKNSTTISAIDSVHF